jgi:flagellar biosynthesis protein FliP
MNTLVVDLGVNAGLSTPMQIVLLLTILTLPALVMSLTPFLRISIIVLHFLGRPLVQYGAIEPGTRPVWLCSYLLRSSSLMITQIYEQAWKRHGSGEFDASQNARSGPRTTQAISGEDGAREGSERYSWK